MSTIFSSFPILITKRLILRESNVNDVSDIYECLSQLDEQKYTKSPKMSDITEAKNVLYEYHRLFNEEEGIRWVIAIKDENTMIGSIGLHEYNEGQKSAILNYELRSEYWQKGIMTEAFEAVLHFGFEVMNLDQIEARVLSQNVKSINLIEKHGFIKRAVLKEMRYDDGEYYDLVMYALLKSEYKQR